METVRLAGWKSQEGKNAYLGAYDSAMRLWPVPFESRQVATRFGSAHVVVSGSPESPPLVLLHAATGFGATQWYPNAAGISERRRMYAIDFIGSAGKGTQTRPLLTRADCGFWLADVIDGLGLGRPDVAGSSQGGWLALNLALLQPDRVGALALLAQAGSIVRTRPEAVTRVLPRRSVKHSEAVINADQERPRTEHRDLGSQAAQWIGGLAS